jgi:hypothetical protein
MTLVREWDSVGLEIDGCYPTLESKSASSARIDNSHSTRGEAAVKVENQSIMNRNRVERDLGQARGMIAARFPRSRATTGRVSSAEAPWLKAYTTVSTGARVLPTRNTPCSSVLSGTGGASITKLIGCSLSVKMSRAGLEPATRWLKASCSTT